MANGDITVTLSITGTRTNGDTITVPDQTKTFTSIADYYYRSGLNIGTTVQTLLSIGTVAGATLAALNCLIVKNEDSSNFVILGLIDTGAKSVFVKIKPGETLQIGGDSLECDDDAGGAFSAFNSTDTVTLKADTAACKCTIFAI